MIRSIVILLALALLFVLSVTYVNTTLAKQNPKTVPLYVCDTCGDKVKSAYTVVLNKERIQDNQIVIDHSVMVECKCHRCYHMD